ncbi:RNA 2',3'-cyclic phosphodiesterase [Terrabacter sp. C0L_2]|uniref:RNA 2',3'-cyclic phosphodiesterase n=1 Tax=Terrabacter sp. C0L_2 TaxID=3108389 RepID=UPI002ED2D401|nr:RNA 2',3'-cyclic phosphodiesterase [Terrabacter sp. C0L_2]
MRLFVAVVPPDDVLDDLEEHLEPRREAGPEIRWTDRHQWHVTLAFLGDVPERRLDDLTEALARSAAKRDPLVLRLAGAGAFPNPYAARVLWAGVEQVRGDLAAVAGGIRNAAASAGATPDGTRFQAHLTLGRFHRPTEATRWIRALDAWEGPAWRVGELALVESHLGEGRGRRPRYEVLADLPLRTRPPRTD